MTRLVIPHATNASLIQNNTCGAFIVAAAIKSRTPDAALRAKPNHMIGNSFASGGIGTRGAMPSTRSASAELRPARIAIPNVWIERTKGKAQSDVDDRSQVLNWV